MVGIRSFPIGEAYFQGRTVSFSECISLGYWFGSSIWRLRGAKVEKNGETTTPSVGKFRNLSFFLLSWLMFSKMYCWVVVWNIFYFHPYLGKWSNLTSIFEMGWNHQLDCCVTLNSFPNGQENNKNLGSPPCPRLGLFPLTSCGSRAFQTPCCMGVGWASYVNLGKFWRPNRRGHLKFRGFVRESTKMPETFSGLGIIPSLKLAVRTWK